MDGLVQIDQQISLWINQHNPAALDGFWSFISGTRVWFPLYGLLGGVIIWKLGWKRGLAVIVTLLVGIVLSDQLANLVKDGVMRLRPCRDPWMLEHGVRCPDGVIGGMYSFFSGHASNVFGFAAGSWAGLQLNDPKGRKYGIYGILIMIWAALISLSRVMLAAHYLGDILVGSLFGLALGYALARLAHWAMVKARL